MNKKLLAVVTMAAIGLGTSAPVVAQSDDESSNDLLEEVMVTATKREQSIYDVPTR